MARDRVLGRPRSGRQSMLIREIFAPDAADHVRAEVGMRARTVSSPRSQLDRCSKCEPPVASPIAKRARDRRWGDAGEAVAIACPIAGGSARAMAGAMRRVSACLVGEPLRGVAGRSRLTRCQGVDDKSYGRSTIGRLAFIVKRSRDVTRPDDSQARPAARPRACASSVG
jgi:hypothetical protein